MSGRTRINVTFDESMLCMTIAPGRRLRTFTPLQPAIG